MTKKNKKEKIKKEWKTETLEEFLARGGKPVIIPPEPVETTNEVVKSSTKGIPHLMDITEGEHYFAEVRKKIKPPVTKSEFLDMVKNSSLPEDIIKSLFSQIKGKNEK